MAGGLMQLVAYGAQDVYLTGNPKVTFFQAVYKRHTNFAMENIQQTVNGSPASSGRVSVTIARNGDLVGNMYVALAPQTFTESNLTSNNINFDVNWIAERAIAAVELTIGGQRIDKHFQTWWRLYSEVFLAEDDKMEYGKMTTAIGAAGASTGTTAYRVYLPLLFFFNRNPGLYLPLIALQYHEVRLDFDLTTYFNSFFSQSVFEVWANYVYLDTEERRRFAQKGHEYLIEQVQHTGGDTIGTLSESSAQLIRLSYNHPVKELVWCYQNAAPTTYLNSMWNFSTNPSNVNVTVSTAFRALSNAFVLPHKYAHPHMLVGASFTNANGTTISNKGFIEEGAAVTSAATAGGYEVGPLHQFKLILNGQDRFKEQYGKYFNQVQPFYHHSGNPMPGIYSYSFALQPEEHQPTGTCNFSRIDNAQVWVALKAGGLSNIQKMFAVNYNILRIQSGMGGLAFSN